MNSSCRSFSPFRVVLLFTPLFLAVACQKDEIRVYRVAKSVDPHADHNHGPAIFEALTPPPPTSSGEIAWKVPQGWKSLPASGMRKATFRMGKDKDEVEMSVIALPGRAGGNLPNVNRWRAQIGLVPLAAEQLGAQSQSVESAAGEMLVVDFTGTGTPPTRVLAAILHANEQAWFFKMTGQGSAVGKAKPKFLRFLKSLRPAK